MSEAAGSQLFHALAQLQAELPKIGKGNTGEVKKDGKLQYTYKYADLADINEQVMPRLGKLGLAFTAKPTMVDGTFVLAYSLTHSSGEREDGFYPLPSTGTSQQLGSAITYARRYALCAVTGVAPDEDDDGAAAQDAPWQGRSAGDQWERSTPATASQPRDGKPRPARPAAASGNPEPARATAPPADLEKWRDQALSKHATPDELLALLQEIEQAGHDGTLTTDETGEKVTFRNLIVRKGREARAATPSLAAPGPEKPGFAAEDDREFVIGFSARLADTNTRAAVALRRHDLELAKAKQQVTAETFAELEQALNQREQQVTGKAAAA